MVRRNEQRWESPADSDTAAEIGRDAVTAAGAAGDALRTRGAAWRAMVARQESVPLARLGA
jgi:hypothetical protein